MFNELVKTILKFEGGYVDHPSDPGGATNFGISLRFMLLTKDVELFDMNKDGKIDKEDVKLLKNSRK
jgi:lysozyme family protein